MAKRKSITGIRKKKKTSKAHTRNRLSESPTEDLLQRPAAGQLLHLRENPTAELHGRSSAAQGRQNEYLTVRPNDALEARQEHVSQATIETQWEKLDASSQQAIQTLLAGVHVPVLANFNSERSKGEAQEFLQTVRASLLKRLPKTPFPRGTTGHDFDHDYLTKINTDTQANLDHVAATISGLKRNVDEQEVALEAEEQSINDSTRVSSHAIAAHSDTTQMWHLPDGGPDYVPNDLPDQIQLIDRHARPSEMAAP